MLPFLGAMAEPCRHYLSYNLKCLKNVAVSVFQDINVIFVSCKFNNSAKVFS